MKIFLIFVVYAFSLLSLNSQTVWEKVNPYMGDYANFKEVKCIDNLNCIGIVNNTDSCCERLIKTTDGGITWFTLYHEIMLFDENDHDRPIEPNPRKMNSIKYLSEDLILISRNKGKIFKSNDGGINFDTIQVVELIDGKYPSSQEIKSLDMYDSLVGAAISSPYLYITEDGWKTSKKLIINLELVPDDYNIKVDRVQFAGAQHFTLRFWANKEISPNNFHFLFDGLITTTDAGNTWHLSDLLKDFDSRDLDINSIFYINSKLGWVVGDVVYDTDNGGRITHGFVYKTYNGGITWDLIHVDESEPTFGLLDIAFYDELNGIAVGKIGKLLRTTDGGYTWFRDVFLDNESQNKRVVQHIEFAGENPILSTFSDGLWRGTYTPSSVKESKEAGKGLSIHPNPASEYIEINIENKGLQPLVNNEEIKIFNTLGECVIELPDVQHLGDVGHLQRIDVSHLSSGVYYLRIGSRTQMFVKI